MLALLADDHLERVMARRLAWGHKGDEMWDGVPHLRELDDFVPLQQTIALLMKEPARARGLIPVLGAYAPRAPGDPRTPREDPPGVWAGEASTAALAVEVLAARARPRLAALAADEVAEVVIVDSVRRSVEWLARHEGEYRPVQASRVIDLRPAALAESIAWPNDTAE
jgi:hypothetical protein